MGPGTSAPDEDRVLLLAPTRRDGEVTRRALAKAEVRCDVCHGTAELAREMVRGVGAVMLTDAALADPGFEGVLRALDRQPGWSNVAVVVLARDREYSATVPGSLARLRNVVLLDRPVSLRSMISAVRASLRARRWQYQIRDQIAMQALAEEALRRADQRKDEFLATLAHELRNPLAPIRTAVQMLMQSGASEVQAQRLLGMMDRQLAQLVRLIDELLDVSRIATGKVVLQRERLDLRAVIEHAVEGSQPAMAAAGHRLAVELPPHPVEVLGDSSRLIQAVGNLLSNAAKYTPDAGSIGVRLVVSEGEAWIEVHDDGLGIPPAMLDRVFDLFAQVDRTLDRAQGGLGIGLSLVRNLMSLHGGSVSAHSDGVNRGSVFRIRLPLAMASGPDTPATGVAAGLADGDGRPLRVLVVDDNADAADSLAMLLELQGHAVRVEYQAEVALETARRFVPDAVVCDLGMPGMDGLEFASELRRDPAFERTRLVALTGWGAQEDQRRSRAAGFDFHLTKPASATSIANILAQG